MTTPRGRINWEQLVPLALIFGAVLTFGLRNENRHTVTENNIAALQKDSPALIEEVKAGRAERAKFLELIENLQNLLTEETKPPQPRKVRRKPSRKIGPQSRQRVADDKGLTAKPIKQEKD